MYRACAVIPTYRHSEALPGLVDRLHGMGLPVFIVDDGSPDPAHSEIAALQDTERRIQVIRLFENRGKGAAVCEGFRCAAAEGYSHAFQIDADGQHDLEAVPRFLSTSQAHPDALICGRPSYDQSIPTGRKIGREITHFWVRVETLSLSASDGMCGFRVYPLQPAIEIIDCDPLDSRMGFDIEILVRLRWAGVPVIDMPVDVTYPPGNLSNFRMLADNWWISCTHTRLVLTMLLRLPVILSRRRGNDENRHWASMSERGAYLGLLFSVWLARLLGRRICLALISPAVLYFYLTGREQREASREFLDRAFAITRPGKRTGWMDGFRHFLSFAGSILDGIAAWSGRLQPDRLVHAADSAIAGSVADPAGALFIVSHFGNADLSRALLDRETRERLIVLVHTHHAVLFNELVRKINPDAGINTLQVTDLGADTIIALRDRIEQGKWVVIAGDRTPVSGKRHVSAIPFLGHDAPFAHGPVVLGAILQCQVYTLFCLRENGRYVLHIDRLADCIQLPRKDRIAAIEGYLRRYAGVLEQYVRRDPYQWYNFYRFWL